MTCFHIRFRRPGDGWWTDRVYKCHSGVLLPRDYVAIARVEFTLCLATAILFFFPSLSLSVVSNK